MSRCAAGTLYASIRSSQSSLRRSLRSPHRLRPLAFASKLPFARFHRGCDGACGTVVGGVTSLSPTSHGSTACRSRRRDSCRINQATSITSCDGWFATCVGAFALMSNTSFCRTVRPICHANRMVSLNLYRPMAIHIWALRKRAGLYGFWRTGRPNSPKTSSSDGRSLCRDLVIVGVGACTHCDGFR